MVKVYCDRCGKELNNNDPRYYPIGDAANGDDTFFVISMYNKKTSAYDSSADDLVYHHGSVDLCPDCMRAINQAVKTVWDGKHQFRH